MDFRVLPVFVIAQDTGTAAASALVGLIGIVVLIVLYFLPTIIAATKKKRSTGGIVVINLLLGWTFIGWVVALAWAATEDTLVAAPVPVPVQTAVLCASCGKYSPPATRFCGHCGAPLQVAPAPLVVPVPVVPAPVIPSKPPLVIKPMTPEQLDKSRRQTKLALIGVGILLVLVVVGGLVGAYLDGRRIRQQREAAAAATPSTEDLPSLVCAGQKRSYWLPNETRPYGLISVRLSDSSSPRDAYESAISCLRVARGQPDLQGASIQVETWAAPQGRSAPLLMPNGADRVAYDPKTNTIIWRRQGKEIAREAANDGAETNKLKPSTTATGGKKGNPDDPDRALPPLEVPAPAPPPPVLSKLRSYPDEPIHVVKLLNDTRYHKSECRIVAPPIQSESVMLSTALRAQLLPCGLCRPDLDPAIASYLTRNRD